MAAMLREAAPLLAHVRVAHTFDHRKSSQLRYIVHPPGSHHIRQHQHLDMGQGEIDRDLFFGTLYPFDVFDAGLERKACELAVYARDCGVQALGFAECALRRKSDAVAAIRGAAGERHFRLVHARLCCGTAWTSSAIHCFDKERTT